MIKINLITNDNDWNKYIKNPKVFLKNKIDNLNKNFRKHRNKNFFFTLLLSGNNEIKKLNKKFRKKNKSTDVLSFPFYSKNQLKNILKKNKEIYLGDVIINIKKVRKKNKKEIFIKEFNKLWVHGLLHLFGYDHKTNQEFKNMIKIEKKFLSFLD